MDLGDGQQRQRKPRRMAAIYGKRQTTVRAVASARTRQLFVASSSDCSSPISAHSPPRNLAPPSTRGASHLHRTPSRTKAPSNVQISETRVEESVDIVSGVIHEDAEVNRLACGVQELRIRNSDAQERVLTPRDVNIQSPPSVRRSPRKLVEKKKEESEERYSRSRSTRRAVAAAAAARTGGEDTNEELRVHAQPLLDLCIDEGSRTLTPFKDWSDSLDMYFNIVKIAEASYGEVYRLSLKPLQQRQTGLTRIDESVLKIIALKPPPLSCSISKKKVIAMSSVASVLSEAQLLQRMTPVPGFTNFRDLRVLKGRPGPSFVAAWRFFDKNVKKSEFPDPGRKTSYEENQLWAVLEMQDAGTDLESVLERSASPIGPEAAWDLFWRTAIALAKGEEWAQFEHRDLHIGNICIRLSASLPAAGINSSSSSPSSAILDAALQSTTAEPSSSCKLGRSGLETTIIDYTLSRARLCSTASNTTASDENEVDNVAFLDLAEDEALFQGDASEEYQYEVYRLMRTAVCGVDKSPKVRRKRRTAALNTTQASKGTEQQHEQQQQWKAYKPMTNIVWLHYLLTKLLSRPSLSSFPSMSSSSSTPGQLPGSHKSPKESDMFDKRNEAEGGEEEDEETQKNIIKACGNDATEIDTQTEEKKLMTTKTKRRGERERKLEKLGKLLFIEDAGPHAAEVLLAKAKVKSATALVEYAVCKGWLDQSDVCG